MKPLNEYPKMANAIQMVTQSLRLRSGANDENIARTHPALEVAVEQKTIDQAAQTEAGCDQPHRDQNDGAGDVLGMNQVERTGKQQAGGQAGLTLSHCSWRMLLSRLGE